MRSAPRSVRIVGATSAVVALGASLLDIVLSMLPGWGPEAVPVSASGWLVQLAGQPALGLRNLDLLNAGVSLAMVPMFIALAWLLLDRSPALVSTGLAFALIGAALFIEHNVALPMYGLATDYTAALAAGEEAPLIGAAESLLAQGRHGSFGAAPGFLISELGTLLVALGMWRVRRGRWLAVAGSFGALVLGVYTVWSLSGAAPLWIAAAGGIAMMGWLSGIAALLLRGGSDVRESVAA